MIPSADGKVSNVTLKKVFGGNMLRISKMTKTAFSGFVGGHAEATHEVSRRFLNEFLPSFSIDEPALSFFMWLKSGELTLQTSDKEKTWCAPSHNLSL